MTTTQIHAPTAEELAAAERAKQDLKYCFIAGAGGILQAGVAPFNKYAGAMFDSGGTIQGKVQIWTFLFTITFVGLFICTGILMLWLQRKLGRMLGGQQIPMRALAPLAERESRKAHLVRWVVGLSASAGLYFPSLLLPAGTSTLWANGCGFFAALFAALMWKWGFVNPKGLPYKTRAKSALCAAIGLAAAAFALKWWGPDGFSSDWGNPYVGILIAGSAIGGFLYGGVQPWVTRKERAVVDRYISVPADRKDVNGWVGFFVSVKITNTFALLSMLTCFEGMTWTGGIPGINPGVSLIVLLALILGLVVMFTGSQLGIQWGNGLGNPGLNGTAIMMSVPAGFGIDALLHSFSLALGAAFTVPKLVGSVVVPGMAIGNYVWTKERKPRRPRRMAHAS